MHVFIYEWITGGGLVEQAGRLPESLLAEGAAMTAAVAEDFLALDDCRVTRLADPRVSHQRLAGETIVEVHGEQERRAEFAAAAAAADYTLLIAPEFDHILARAFRAAREVSATILGGSADLIRVASCKQSTSERLLAAGVPTPEAVLLEADAERLPRDFAYPGVLKPLDGAGSQHTYLVEGPLDEPPPYPWPRRLERYVPGRAASVAAICGPGGYAMLPPCWQRQSVDGRFTYLGGATIDERPLAERARQLAGQALAALPPATGFVGVDLVLGNAPAGDAVIEVNPRLTTSYVGLREVVAENLAAAMIAARHGDVPECLAVRDGVEFTLAGVVASAAKP
ncbi:MAG: hypothetical protein CMJ58_18530 [Planctomycetaceae bacterium]|nr:hypothetical protein [Planctomycetaceae bacterium]